MTSAIDWKQYEQLKARASLTGKSPGAGASPGLLG